MSTAIWMTVGLACSVALATGAGRQSSLHDEVARVEASTEVLRELVDTPDAEIPAYLLQRAEAIIVLPNLIRGGFVVGASHGSGIISVVNRQTRTWSPPAFVSMTGGSIGWQIGVAAIDLTLLVMNERGVRDLLEDRFTIGANASIVAGPVGRSATAASDAQLSSQILAYSRARGLFAGATFDGAALRADREANERVYGAVLSVILNGTATPPSAAHQAFADWSALLQRVTSSGASPRQGAAGAPM